MNLKDKIKEELGSLIKEGMAFINEKTKKDGPSIIIGYQSWYTKALLTVRQFSPDRLEDFASQYQQPKRKSISASTYTIHDFLHGLSVNDHLGKPIFDTYSVFFARLMHQLGMLKGALNLCDSKLNDIHTTIQLELLDQDLIGARGLLKAKQFRSAGVVCGVILESHLKSVAVRRGIEIKKSSISDLNDRLKENGAYDVSLWRLLQRLADIRNLCCHSKERDPKADEVDDLISGTDKILKEVV
jgi:hypothetical protein